MPHPDPIFAEPRLAALYDALDPDRGDLDAYLAIVAEVGAHSVLDLGCGTGSLAVRLAAGGIEVTGADPAAASLAVARAKPRASKVRWVHGDAASLPQLQVDLALMTGNVAQVFTGDEQWSAMLRGVRAALRPGGHLVFEVRDPRRRAWESWTPEGTYQRASIPGVGVVQTWCRVTAVAGDLVTFRWTFQFERDGTQLTSDSTLRFRGRTEITSSLSAHGFDVVDIRDAPDRPGLELVFLARAGGPAATPRRA
jgi:SAM-dependent methyltransferase